MTPRYDLSNWNLSSKFSLSNWNSNKIKSDCQFSLRNSFKSLPAYHLNLCKSKILYNSNNFEEVFKSTEARLSLEMDFFKVFPPLVGDVPFMSPRPPEYSLNLPTPCFVMLKHKLISSFSFCL